MCIRIPQISLGKLVFDIIWITCCILGNNKICLFAGLFTICHNFISKFLVLNHIFEKGHKPFEITEEDK